MLKSVWYHCWFVVTWFCLGCPHLASAGGKGSKGSKSSKFKQCKSCLEFDHNPFSCNACSNCLYYSYDDTCRPAGSKKDKTYCACQECTASVWHTHAEGFTCGQRVEFLLSDEGGSLTEAEACTFVAQEYDSECSLCYPFCKNEEESTPPTHPTMAPTIVGTTASPAVGQTTSLPSHEISSEPPSEMSFSMFPSEQSSSSPSFVPSSLFSDTPSLDETTESSLWPSTYQSLFPSILPSTLPSMGEWPETVSTSMIPTLLSTAAEQPPSVSAMASSTFRPTNNAPCGCQSCTSDILWGLAGDSARNCQEQIGFVRVFENVTEIQACSIVARAFPDTCGIGCDPETCDGRTIAPSPSSLPGAPSSSQVYFCGCMECTLSVLAGRYSSGWAPCGSTILRLQQPDEGSLSREEACRVAGQREDICAPCNPDVCDGKPTPAPGPACGCESCTDQVLDTDADGDTCRARIEYMQSYEGGLYLEEDACRFVAEERAVCSRCNPDTC